MRSNPCIISVKIPFDAFIIIYGVRSVKHLALYLDCILHHPHAIIQRTIKEDIAVRHTADE